MNETAPVLKYSSTTITNKRIKEELNLDSVVMSRWDLFMQRSNFRSDLISLRYRKLKFYCRYNVNNIKEKVVEGKIGYLVQSQLERAKLRRPPQSMMSVRQAFDKEKFNFTKIDESKELVCELVNEDRPSDLRDILIINVSPCVRGHSLLVPHVESCLPQVYD